MTHPPLERSRFVSAQEVADRAGVSRSAVSRAFTPGASVGEETRRKVMQAAEELGYQVNDLARGLLASKSRLVGIVATRPEVGFRAHLAAALVRRLIRRGSVPVMIDTGSNEAEMSAAQRTLFGHRAEATIILSGSAAGFVRRSGTAQRPASGADRPFSAGCRQRSAGQCRRRPPGSSAVHGAGI